MEIEALDENIGSWEMTWFNYHILHFKCFNLVGYDLYQWLFWRWSMIAIRVYNAWEKLVLCNYWYVA